MARPLFIMGVARSGTNLLAGMLNGHQRVSVVLDPLMPLFRLWRNLALVESGFEIAPSAAFADGYFSADGPQRLDALLAANTAIRTPVAAIPALREAVRSRVGLEHPELTSQFDDWNGASIHELFKDAFGRLELAAIRRHQVEWIGIKEVWVVDFLPALARAFPDARFVVIERDPRGIIASLAGLARRDSGQNAHHVSYLRHWRKSIALSRVFASDPLLSPRLYRLRFEDAVADPRKIAFELARFLDLEFEEGMLTPRLANGAPRPANSSFDIKGTIAKDAAGIWRQQLGPDPIALVEALCAPDMRLAGYSPEGRFRPDDPEVRRAWDATDANPGSWRSDSGDRRADLAGELLRNSLVDSESPDADSATLRRCFLFEKTYDLLRVTRFTQEISQ